MKLALGTVQFGVNYGISNNSGIPTATAIKKVFTTAHSLKINTFDTALAYGNAEQNIAPYLRKNDYVISKFPKNSSSKNIRLSLKQSLNNLKLNNLYGYMAHNANDIINDEDLWKVLIDLKNEKLVSKIGYSLYTTEELEKLLSLNYIPQIIQIPYSLLDRKFEPYFQILKSYNTEVHTRSTFLQGLYFLNPNLLPEILLPLKDALIQLQLISQKNNYPISNIALQFVLSNKNIDKVVIGVLNDNQLLENYELAEKKIENLSIFEEINQIIIKDKHLLNPANWQK